MNEDDELEKAKEDLKKAVAAGDQLAVDVATRKIARIKNFKAEQRTFMHDSGNLVAWGEPEGEIKTDG